LLRREELCPGLGRCPDSTAETPCADCPRVKLDSWLASPLGHALRNVLDLDFALQMRMHVSLDDINYREFLLLRALAEQRNLYQEEQIRKQTER
jgi:hypothetical protein